MNESESFYSKTLGSNEIVVGPAPFVFFVFLFSSLFCFLMTPPPSPDLFPCFDVVLGNLFRTNSRALVVFRHIPSLSLSFSLSLSPFLSRTPPPLSCLDRLSVERTIHLVPRHRVHVFHSVTTRSPSFSFLLLRECVRVCVRVCVCACVCVSVCVCV